MFRITAAAPAVTVADPAANVRACVEMIDSVGPVDLVVLPELGLTGYTCGDLFATDALLRGALGALRELTRHSAGHDAIVAAGLPMVVDDSLMNVAAVIGGGRIHGLVPKTYLPTYREFYEARHFRGSGPGDPASVRIDGVEIPFGTDLLFRRGQAVIAVEICEDLWMPVPPSSLAAVAGANVVVNLSGGNETIGKPPWRRDLVRSQSGRCIAAYAYAGSGPGESTSDAVFGGHCMVAENGHLLGQSRRIGDGQEPILVDETSVTCDVDLQRLAHDRRVIGSFDDLRDRSEQAFRVLDLEPVGEPKRPAAAAPRQPVDGQPFVPKQSSELEARCAEILGLQAAGLKKRLLQLPESLPLAIGVSGGLDSTLALLVALRVCDAMGQPRTRIHGITMPGFGTTAHTRSSADQLIQATGITAECIDIRALCLDTFRALRHNPLGIRIDDSTTAESLQEELMDTAEDAQDLVFENIQARVRTMLLMNRGFVLGTGDMSEQALGWSTYNGDHMSMYNVNTSIPKTLVRFLVRYAADHYFGGQLQSLLHRVADTPISPELLPPAPDGSIRQATEASIGSYELHDFFLYHFVRNGFSRDKILYLAQHARFEETYSASTVAQTLDEFIRRFFRNQFKRNCVPDGPKVGTVSLSPRGDWRMPSDASPAAFGDEPRQR